MSATKTTEKYIEATGRRKTSVARVRLTPASKTTYKINDRELAVYFPTVEMAKLIASAFEISKSASPAGEFSVSAHIKGGGIHSQAEAMRHGIARALSLHDMRLREPLKKAGMLKRDPRAKERRKFGLKKARKAPQWSKR